MDVITCSHFNDQVDFQNTAVIVFNNPEKTALFINCGETPVSNSYTSVTLHLLTRSSAFTLYIMLINN